MFPLRETAARPACANTSSSTATSSARARSGADVELIALCIDLLRGFGFTRERCRGADQRSRILDRFPEGPKSYRKSGGRRPCRSSTRASASRARKRRAMLGASRRRRFSRSSMAAARARSSNDSIEALAQPRPGGLRASRSADRARTRLLHRRCLRGLRSRGKLRAIAGGGRYDNLIAQLSDGAISLPALGFAMGDVVLGELIRETCPARETEMEPTIPRAASSMFTS